LAIGACVAWVWSSVFDTHGPWNSFFWFFMVIFLFSWGGGSWVHPFGPTGWGVAWLPIVFMGIFMALLLTAATPRANRSRTRSTNQVLVAPKTKAKTIAELEMVATVDLFFWAFILVLGFLIVSNLLWHSPVI
jgi:hypothetical protein